MPVEPFAAVAAFCAGVTIVVTLLVFAYILNEG